MKVTKIKVSTSSPAWPWIRQTSGGSGCWGDYEFQVDQPGGACDYWVVFENILETDIAVCDKRNTMFVTGEPNSVGSYHRDFLAQFSCVVTSRDDVIHPNVIRSQQGQSWFVEKNYDELVNMKPIHKMKDICLIVSDKKFTEGHRKRLEFSLRLKELLGDCLDIYGRGINDFSSKWDVLSQYRYAIVLENSCEDDYLSEKLPDALLAYCYPFYSGCPNLGKYLEPGCVEVIDIDFPEQVAGQIMACLEDPSHYSNAVPGISKARQTYLEQLQFFPNVAGLVSGLRLNAEAKTKPFRLRPASAFGRASPLRLALSRLPPPVKQAFKRLLKSAS